MGKLGVYIVTFKENLWVKTIKVDLYFEILGHDNSCDLAQGEWKDKECNSALFSTSQIDKKQTNKQNNHQTRKS